MYNGYEFETKTMTVRQKMNSVVAELAEAAEASQDEKISKALAEAAFKVAHAEAILQKVADEIRSEEPPMSVTEDGPAAYVTNGVY